MSKVLVGYKFLQTLIDGGIIPERTVHVVIEARADNIVTIYYQVDASEALDVVFRGGAIEVLAEEARDNAIT